MLYKCKKIEVQAFIYFAVVCSITALLSSVKSKQVELFLFFVAGTEPLRCNCIPFLIVAVTHLQKIFCPFLFSRFFYNKYLLKTEKVKI